MFNKNRFILIEGDNGAGKDSLAKRIEKKGFKIVTYFDEVKAAELKARNKTGEERVLSFMQYNKLCGEHVDSLKKPCILIRYWVSTLAAAYADSIIDLGELEKKALRCIELLPLPDKIIYLSCGFIERNRRVEKRGVLGDDMSQLRDERYSIAINKLMNVLPFFFTIDTTRISEQEVYFESMKIIDREIKKY